MYPPSLISLVEANILFHYKNARVCVCMFLNLFYFYSLSNCLESNASFRYDRCLNLGSVFLDCLERLNYECILFGWIRRSDLKDNSQHGDYENRAQIVTHHVTNCVESKLHLAQSAMLKTYGLMFDIVRVLCSPSLPAYPSKHLSVWLISAWNFQFACHDIVLHDGGEHRVSSKNVSSIMPIYLTEAKKP